MIIKNNWCIFISYITYSTVEGVWFDEAFWGNKERIYFLLKFDLITQALSLIIEIKSIRYCDYYYIFKIEEKKTVFIFLKKSWEFFLLMKFYLIYNTVLFYLLLLFWNSYFNSKNIFLFIYLNCIYLIKRFE